MLRVMKFSSLILLCILVLIPGIVSGQEGEEGLFSLIVEPDALIALDLSGSMAATPYGDDMYSNSRYVTSYNPDGTPNYKCDGDRAYGQSTGGYSLKCGHNNYVCSASRDCSEPYYQADLTTDKRFRRCSGGTYDCRKANIARKAIFALLDDDGNGRLQRRDQESLGIRVAYMRFKNCNTVEDPISSPDYRSGCNQLLYEFKDIRTNNYYSDFFNTISNDIDSGFANKTPLRAQLLEAKAYLNDHKNGNASRGIPADPLRDCRKKFVLFITDGWDTLACGGDYDKEDYESQSYSYMRRRATIKAAKEVADAGYKVFVIGFGADMPPTENNTLEWAAKFAGTNNPLVDDSGDVNAISIVQNPCNPESCTPDQVSCTNAPNDPGYAPLSGYAYLATNAASLNQALRRAMDYIKEARYSFTVSSVSAARVLSENYLYEASFIPLESDPLWMGYLKKYAINEFGEVVRPAQKDAGEKLKAMGASSRNMFTLVGGTMRLFNTANITPDLLGLFPENIDGRNAVVGYFRGEEDYNGDNWKLGDIFHSNPITIASPPVYYNDFRSPGAYATHKANHKNRERLVVVGANDGQFHAFSAGEMEEKWSFIPPNLLPKLKLVAHSTEPAPIPNHQFFVDGPVTVAEAWLGSGNGVDPPAGSGKNASDWRTLLIFGLGKGVRGSHANNHPIYLWSNSPNCDSGFSRKHYFPHHIYYCGYYAFDVTDTSLTQPVFKWRINVADRSQGLYLDEPWSKMVTGRVWIDGNEKWVGFIGGGFSGDDLRRNRDYDDDDFETRGKRGGKGFFVIDLSNGNILWSYTRDTDSDMDYPIPAAPAVVDWDSDGFIDTAYIADLGGNLWRFRFCSYQDYRNGQSCNTAHWKGGRLYDASAGERPVFTRPTVASDQANRLWVFWGTGNRMVPASTGAQDRFFALKDTFVPAKSGTTPPRYTISNLQNITSTTYAGVQPGWYILFPGSGEKSLSDPTVFGGMVLFTTYTPASTTAITCTSAGTGSLYAVAMMPMAVNGVLYDPGTGLWANGARSISLGTGVPTSPVISQKPTEQYGATDVFVTVSGGGGTDTVTKSLAELTAQRGSAARTRLEETPPQAQITHWRDRRLR